MGEQTGISWTDHTFNPWWGCVKVSPACTHCYAETFSKRVGLKVWGADSERRFFGDKHWAEPEIWNAKAEQAGVRRRVFCASMADVFEDRPDLEGPRDRLWDLIDATPALDWLLLTKRPEHIATMVPWLDDEAPPHNVSLGTTVESNDYRERIAALLRVPAAHHFISYEPALGPLDLSDYLPVETIGGVELETFVDWVIAGGESGAHARPSHPEWFRAVRDQCRAVGVAFHFKQWGEWLPVSQLQGDSADLYRHYEPTSKHPEGRSVCKVDTKILQADGRVEFAFPNGAMQVFRVGKKAAGRLLDGREWNDFPDVHT